METFAHSEVLAKNYEKIDPIVKTLARRKEKAQQKISIVTLEDDPENDNERPKTPLRKRYLTKLKIFWAFINCLISAADVTVILYLSHLHFSHASDLIAWIMLLPILLNFIGMFVFLSNKAERREMESLGCRATKNLMFFPVIGPTFGSIRLFFYAFEEEDAEKFERLESLLLRMKQYESYFRAAPEAFVQITYKITTWSRHDPFKEKDFWTIACIFLSLFTLAESHMYGVVIKYYRMFKYDPTPNAWRVDHISVLWKFYLFIYTYCSIASRLLADAIQKATWSFYFHDETFGEVIVVNFLCQFIIRAAFFAGYNLVLGSAKRQAKIHDQGVYGAFTYAWRCCFISLDFQSYTKVIFLWFYVENFLMILVPYIWIYGTPWFHGDEGKIILADRLFFHVNAITALITGILAVVIKVSVRYHFKRKEKKRSRATPPPQIVIDKAENV